MLRSPKTWIAVFGLVFLYMAMGRPSKVVHTPGILAPSQPRQVMIDDPKRWKKDDYVITPLAEYDITGVVVRTRRYYFGKEADLSPIDYVMAWGAASDTEVIDHVKWSQSGRFYWWKTSDEGIDPSSVSRNSANVHIIPANDTIASKLKSVRWEQVVDLSGYLVRIDDPKGWSWTSSLTRDDTGNGACEVFWVDHAVFR